MRNNTQRQSLWSKMPYYPIFCGGCCFFVVVMLFAFFIRHNTRIESDVVNCYNSICIEHLWSQRLGSHCEFDNGFYTHTHTTIQIRSNGPTNAKVLFCPENRSSIGTKRKEMAFCVRWFHAPIVMHRLGASMLYEVGNWNQCLRHVFLRTVAETSKRAHAATEVCWLFSERLYTYIGMV